jgi:hypothetical protein
MRDWLLLVVLSVGIGLFSGVLAHDFLVGRVDATWWRVLPWALLALLWLGLGVWAWRRRRRQRRLASEKDM